VTIPEKNAGDYRACQYKIKYLLITAVNADILDD